MTAYEVLGSCVICFGVMCAGCLGMCVLGWLVGPERMDRLLR